MTKPTVRAAGTGKRKGTGARLAHDWIREQILDLKLEPGQSLDEPYLVRTLGVSRTPVREALVQLAAEGLVDLLPNRGARVSQVDLASIREFFEALDVAQRMTSRLTALRGSRTDLQAIERELLAFEDAAARGDVRDMMDANLRFHAAIGAACGNSLVAKHYEHLLTIGLRLSRISFMYEGPDPQNKRPGHVEKIILDHRAFLVCIEARDADAAEALGRAHMELFRRHITDYLSENLSREIRVDDIGRAAGPLT